MQRYKYVNMVQVIKKKQRYNELKYKVKKSLPAKISPKCMQRYKYINMVQVKKKPKV